MKCSNYLAGLTGLALIGAGVEGTLESRAGEVFQPLSIERAIQGTNYGWNLSMPSSPGATNTFYATAKVAWPLTNWAVLSTSISGPTNYAKSAFVSDKRMNMLFPGRNCGFFAGSVKAPYEEPEEPTDSNLLDSMISLSLRDDSK